MSIEELQNQIKNIEKKRRAILKALLQPTPLIIGTVTKTKGRCGKANCSCVKKPSHEITLLLTKRNGKNRSQLVRKNDVKKITQLWVKYKNLKKKLSELQEHNKEEIDVLNEIMHCRKIDYNPE